MRWEIAIRAVAHGIDGAADRIAAERERDPSDRGERAGLRAEVAVPDAGSKAEAWRRFHDEGYGSLHLTAAAMAGFHWHVQREMLEPWTMEFFDRVANVFETGENQFTRSYFASLFPHGRVEERVLDRSRALLGRPRRAAAAACSARCVKPTTTWSERSAAAPSPPRDGRRLMDTS